MLLVSQCKNDFTAKVKRLDTRPLYFEKSWRPQTRGIPGDQEPTHMPLLAIFT